MDEMTRAKALEVIANDLLDAWLDSTDEDVIEDRIYTASKRNF